MNTLLSQKDHIFNIKSKVNCLDNSMYTHTCLNSSDVSRAISIIMAASNRSKQTYFTLKTIAKSSHKDIQVIIVDDGDIDPLDVDILKEYPFHIDLIRINRANKDWHNPLVNYNIGFKFVCGSMVVIQNAEVCHVGDPLAFIGTSMSDNEYYVYDVKACASFDANEVIYNSDTINVDMYNQDLFSLWYQGRERFANYHFFTAMTRSTFDRIAEFSYDCTMGASFDDDDLVLKIISMKIAIINLFHDQYNFGGIHLYHVSALDTWDKDCECNGTLVRNKQRVFNSTGEYIDAIGSGVELFDQQYQKLLL